MKINIRSYSGFLLIFFLLLPSLLGSCGDEYSLKKDGLNINVDMNTTSQKDFPCIDNLQKEDLNEEEVSGLIFIREEEKLARDVYKFLYEIYPVPIFNNISGSEQQHMDAVKRLLEKYDLDDPAEGLPPGEFKDMRLQELYNFLIKRGQENRLSALMVGALIEETDIFDIQAELDQNVDNQDIKFVYSNLIRGSGHHLNAFVRWIRSYNIEYEPEVITPDLYYTIVGDQ